MLKGLTLQRTLKLCGMSFTLPDYPPDDIIGNVRRAVKHIYYANVIERGQTRRPDYTLIYSHNQYTHSLLYVFVDLLTGTWV